MGLKLSQPAVRLLEALMEPAHAGLAGAELQTLNSNLSYRAGVGGAL